MLNSVELLLARAGDDAVRLEWAELLEAGLPSQARHRGPSNAPHLTLWAGSELSESATTALAALTLPLQITLGPLVVLGHGRWALARLVAADPELLSLRARVLESTGHDQHDLWVPHVTLARRLSADQVGRALTVLTSSTPLAAEVSALRHWDPASATTTVLARNADRPDHPEGASVNR